MPKGAASGGNPLFAQVADRIFTWVRREMTSEDGGFYCSQDADAEGREGSFCLLAPDEVKAALGEEKGREFCRRSTTSRTEATLKALRSPTLLRADSPAMAEDWALLRLYQYRAGRMALHRDDKRPDQLEWPDDRGPGTPPACCWTGGNGWTPPLPRLISCGARWPMKTAG